MMSKQIQKSFRNGLSKLKTSNKNIKLLRLPSCGRPKTPSFKANEIENEKENEENNAVTLSDIDKFLSENFKSLYNKKNEEKEEEEEEISINDNAYKKKSPYMYESRRLFEPPPRENLCGSPRFFIPTTSSTSMITDEIGSPSVIYDYSKSDEEAEEVEKAPDDFIALLSYSRSPYGDFKKSMQGMVEARLEQDGDVDWEFMEELLSCYLELNNKKSARFILQAFVDLVASLREKERRVEGSRRQRKGGKCNLM